MFMQYDSAPRGDVCSPAASANHVLPPLSRDFQHGGAGTGMDTIQHHQQFGRLTTNGGGRPDHTGTAFSPGMKSAPTVPFQDRLPPYTPMSTTPTSGFVPGAADPTSGLPVYPFYNFEAMNAAVVSTGLTGSGGAAPPPLAEVDFRSTNGYLMSGDGGMRAGSLQQRYAVGDCRPGTAMSTTGVGPGFLDRAPYVNVGITALEVNASAGGQQLSPSSSVTSPTSPTAIVYPWMTIVGQYIPVI